MVETRIDKIYKYGRKIEGIKLGIRKLEKEIKSSDERMKVTIDQMKANKERKIEGIKLEIQKHNNNIKSYESQIKMIKKSIEDQPGK